MNQEVRVILQLTLDVDCKLSKEEIEERINEYFTSMQQENKISEEMILMNNDVIQIEEEAEIYGTKE